MAKMYDRVMFVLGHGGTRSELRAVLRNELACRYVLIFQIARVSLPMGLGQIRVLVLWQGTHNGGKEPMKWKEF